MINAIIAAIILHLHGLPLTGNSEASALLQN